MIDSHTHLDACDPPDEDLVAAALEAGVERMVTIGTSVESSRAALEAAERFPQVWAAVGRHPNTPGPLARDEIDRLRELARHPRCVAVGETGLDRYRDSADPDEQQAAFEAHIELAREVGKPLVIHTRAAEQDTVETLARLAGGLEVIMHCFSMPERLEECLERGWWISFAGNVTYPSAAALADAAERVPAERVLVETDAPYLSPVPLRGKPNQPANVAHTARFLAERRGVALAELEAQLARNAAQVLGW